MRRFPAFSFQAKHNRACFMRRFPENSFQRITDRRERGEKFVYAKTWGAFIRKSKPLPVAF
jgi:hypothetical protein